MNVTDVKQAILRGEQTFNGIVLPSPQRSGTFTQQSTYAYKAAQEFVEKNKNNG